MNATIDAARVNPSVLVVEDEPHMQFLLSENLSLEGYGVKCTADAEGALAELRRRSYDVLIVDVMLPRMSGFEFCREVRARGVVSPLIMLTARAEETDRVLGLDLGADDYVTKPFSPQELVLRVAAVLRRAQAPAIAGSSRILRGGPITVDLNAMRVEVDGEEVQLTPTEYRLLVTLLERRGRVQSREQLLEAAWDIHVRIETRTVDMHVQRLRTKLGPGGELIETIRGFGYRFRGKGEEA